MALTPHAAALAKIIRGVGYRHSRDRLFSDCVELCAIALAQIDPRGRDAREERFAQIEAAYDAQEREQFSRFLGELVLALEDAPSDVLGSVFGELELGNAAAGQFFTPFEISRLMAKTALGDGAHARSIIEQHGFIAMQEPACGAGSMVIAFAEELRALGINYQQHLHVTAIDVDRRAAYMAFCQLALLHIPAVVIVGNTITLDERERWYTPAHILGLWDARLAFRRRQGPGAEVHAIAAPPVADDAPKMPAQQVVTVEHGAQIVHGRRCAPPEDVGDVSEHPQDDGQRWATCGLAVPLVRMCDGANAPALAIARARLFISPERLLYVGRPRHCTINGLLLPTITPSFVMDYARSSETTFPPPTSSPPTA